MPFLAVAQKPAVVSSAGNWVMLNITATDTVAAPPKAVARKTRPTPPTSSSGVVASAKTAVKKTDVTPEVPVARPTTATPARPVVRTFLETFASNDNGWLLGKRNGFDLEIDRESYYIRREKAAAGRPGRSYIKLPDNLNLNRSDTFTVSVEMAFPAGVEPDGGLLIGVKDTSNYCQFRLIGTSKVALYTRVNGKAETSYMTGKPTLAKVPVSLTKNTLTIRRTGNQLHFYVNGREVEDSPHPFKPFKGNGVGFINFAETAKFQYLTVQLGK